MASDAEIDNAVSIRLHRTRVLEGGTGGAFFEGAVSERWRGNVELSALSTMVFL
jgi:hypothetical protein